MIKKFVVEGEVDKGNWVNRAAPATEVHRVQIRHLDKVGVLSHVFAVLSAAGWNLQELENIVFKDRKACMASITFEGDVSKSEEVSK